MRAVIATTSCWSADTPARSLPCLPGTTNGLPARHDHCLACLQLADAHVGAAPPEPAVVELSSSSTTSDQQQQPQLVMLQVRGRQQHVTAGAQPPTWRCCSHACLLACSPACLPACGRSPTFCQPLMRATSRPLAALTVPHAPRTAAATLTATAQQRQRPTQQRRRRQRCARQPWQRAAAAAAAVRAAAMTSSSSCCKERAAVVRAVRSSRLLALSLTAPACQVRAVPLSHTAAAPKRPPTQQRLQRAAAVCCSLRLALWPRQRRRQCSCC